MRYVRNAEREGAMIKKCKYCKKKYDDDGSDILPGMKVGYCSYCHVRGRFTFEDICRWEAQRVEARKKDKPKSRRPIPNP